MGYFLNWGTSFCLVFKGKPDRKPTPTNLGDDYCEKHSNNMGSVKTGSQQTGGVCLVGSRYLLASGPLERRSSSDNRLKEMSVHMVDIYPHSNDFQKGFPITNSYSDMDARNILQAEEVGRPCDSQQGHVCHVFFLFSSDPFGSKLLRVP